MSPRENILSVDVEDYFHVEAFADVVNRATWPSFSSRVEDNTRRILDLLDSREIKATFFILGWVAERHASLVREIIARGHEPACHSFWHRRVYRLDREQFRDDTRLAKDTIEQAGGVGVRGYRAPSFSIVARSLWALELLAEAGFAYDSSIFPIGHDVYGIPDAPRGPFRINTPSGPILEYPITTFRLGGSRNFPVGGGGYLRLLPFWYTKLGARRAWKDELPLIVYIHPWEIDPAQPRLKGRLKSRVRHYSNLGKTEARLIKLLGMASFTSFRDSRLDQSAPLVQQIQITKGLTDDHR